MIQLQLGLEAIRSYRRLSYTTWHALAEFVDNSTQSYFNHRAEMDEAYRREGQPLTVSITYDRKADLLRIADNAMGMDLEELERALHIGEPPPDPTGRSKYGMGLKTAACWFGQHWSLKTKKLGEPTEYFVEVDVEEVAGGNNALEPHPTAKAADQHYTILEITQLNRRIVGRGVGKVKQFLSSIYRKDLVDKTLILLWQGEELSWELPDSQFMRQRDGDLYRRTFKFEVAGNDITGWAGILGRGHAGRDKAGFSILQSGRVIKGWPASWRPAKIYGQMEGSNDLVNQRLVGEINLDGFEPTHTKDDIDWIGEEEEQVEEKLAEAVADLREVAKTPYKAMDDTRGPSNIDVQTAVDEFQNELASDEMVDALSVDSVPPPEIASQAFQPLLEVAEDGAPAFSAKFAGIEVVGYLAYDASVNDPYVLADSSDDAKVLIVINMQHPHFRQIVGAEGVLNYFRHCTYDALAEWKARKITHRLDSTTIKLLKDQLLRIPLAMEMHAGPGD